MTIPWWWNEDPAKLEAERQTERLIQSYLRQPPKRRVTLADHTPWDMVRHVCIGCGRTKAELFDQPVMPPCKPR